MELFDALSTTHIEFINNQHIFFVGTAGAEGRVNVSPKGLDTLRVLDGSRVVWLNLTGSGNETAAHIAENARMTLMFCSFDRQPLILRVYGTAKITHPRDEDWDTFSDLFEMRTGARQYFDLNVDMVQTSCGYAVPEYKMTGDRPTLIKWAANKGDAGIESYWSENNQKSLDGNPTNIIAPD
jgi:hypothetical protein